MSIEVFFSADHRQEDLLETIGNTKIFTFAALFLASKPAGKMEHMQRMKSNRRRYSLVPNEWPRWQEL